MPDATAPPPPAATPRSPGVPLTAAQRAALVAYAAAMLKPPPGAQLVRHGRREVPCPLDVLCRVYRRLTGRGRWQLAAEGEPGGERFIDLDPAEEVYLGVPLTVADHFGLVRPAAAGYTTTLNLWRLFAVWDQDGSAEAVATEIHRLIARES